MPDAYEIAEVSDESLWDEFVLGAAGGSVFSTCAWLRCARAATGGRYRCLGCFKNGQLLAGVSGLERRRWALTRFVTPELTPYGGLLFAPLPSKGPAKLEAEWNRGASLLIARLARQYDHVQLVHTPAVGDVREFTWAGWNARVRYTYQIDLGDLDLLWERTERRARTVIRKAERAGFQLLPFDDLDLFRRQYEQIYTSRNGSLPIPADVVQCFVRQVLEAGLGRAWAIVSPAGAVASTVVFVHGFDTAYAWVAGADPALNSTGATSLLYWRFFEQTPFQRFDFVGANIPAIARFKRSFGGDLVPYYAVEGFRNARVRMLFAARRAVRDILP